MKKSRILKKCIFLFCIIMILMMVISVMLRYEVEGEKSLPYNLSKILVVSTVEGLQNDDGQNIWNINVKQVNDLYVYIEKDGETGETLKEVTIENFVVTKEPQKGELTIYRPTGDLQNLYTHSEQNYMGKSLTYTGAAIDDLKTLEIANNGGVLGLRISLDNLGNFISNESTEITYDGKLLQNIGVSLEQIEFALSFDILIKTNSDVTYKGTISLNLPAEDIIENGSSNFEITNFDDIVFKRM